MVINVLNFKSGFKVTSLINYVKKEIKEIEYNSETLFGIVDNLISNKSKLNKGERIYIFIDSGKVANLSHFQNIYLLD